MFARLAQKRHIVEEKKEGALAALLEEASAAFVAIAKQGGDETTVEKNELVDAMQGDFKLFEKLDGDGARGMGDDDEATREVSFGKFATLVNDNCGRCSDEI